MTTVKLPSTDLHGHARLYGRRNSHMGGPASLTLYGTAEEPQVYADTPDAFSGIGVQPRPEDLIRFAREVLAFFGKDYGVTLPPWRPASNGTSARPWFLVRGDDDPGIPLKDRYHFGAGGSLVRYASVDTAQRAANQLNAAEQKTP